MNFENHLLYYGSFLLIAVGGSMDSLLESALFVLAGVFVNKLAVTINE